MSNPCSLAGMQPLGEACAHLVSQEREGQPLCLCERSIGVWRVAADAEHLGARVLEDCWAKRRSHRCADCYYVMAVPSLGSSFEEFHVPLQTLNTSGHQAQA